MIADTGTSRGTKRKLAGMDPYILHRFNVQPNFHIDKELLFEKKVQLFFAKMEDDEGKTYMFTLLPHEFYTDMTNTYIVTI